MKNTSQNQEFENINNQKQEQEYQQQLISINDEPLRVPFSSNDFSNKYSFYNPEIDEPNTGGSSQTDKNNCGIEFIMTAEVCPKKNRAAAASQINQIDDEKILSDNRRAEHIQLLRSFTTVYDGVSRGQALASIENNTDNMNMFETRISKISEEATINHIDDGDHQDQNQSRQKMYNQQLKKNTAYQEDKKITSYLPRHRLRTRAEAVTNSNYHSDGEISSMSPHKSPGRMSSPEKLLFAKKVFARNDKVSRKVQRAMTKANQVRTEMQELIVAANKVQEVYKEEQDNFIKAIEVQQEKLERQQTKKNRFLDNKRYKRVGDLTDPATLVRPAFARKEPTEEPKKDAHEECWMSKKHQRQHSTLVGTEYYETVTTEAGRSKAVANQRKSANCQYSHVMPRVNTGRSQLGNIIMSNSKEVPSVATSENASRSLKHLARLRSAHPNRKKSMPLVTDTPQSSKKQTSTSLIKLQTINKSLNNNHSCSGTPLAATGLNNSDTEGTDQLHSQNTTRSSKSYKSANTSFRNNNKKSIVQTKDWNQNQYTHCQSKIINYIIQNPQQQTSDYQPIMSCVPEIVNQKNQNKSRSSQRMNHSSHNNGASSQTPLKSNSSNIYVRASTKINRNNFMTQNRTHHNQTSSASRKRRTVHQNLNVPAFIRDENDNPMKDQNTSIRTPKNKGGFHTIYHHASKYETSKKSSAAGYETVAFMDSTNRQGVRSIKNRHSTPKSNSGIASSSQAHSIRIKKFLTREQKKNIHAIEA